MKMIRSIYSITGALVAIFLSASSIHAAVTTWNDAIGGSWSASTNWTPLGVPGTTSDVTFGNVGTGSLNTNDILSETINSLTYDWNNQLQQTTVIPLGQTLTVNSSLAAGSALLLVGSATAAPAAGTLAPAAITGGGNLALSGAGDIVVHIGNATAGAHMATLDLSGLANLTANVGRLLIGQANGGATVNRPSGTLILAATNTITLTGGSPQVMVQDGGSNANGGTVSLLEFGQVNFLNGDTMRFGGQKGNGNVNFNSAFASPSLTIRNADGVSPCTVIDFGYNAAVTTGNSTVCVADFTPGTVNISANLVHVANGPVGPGTGTCTSTLTLGAGTNNIGDLEIGFANAGGLGNSSGVSGATTGTLNVNNNGAFPAGAIVNVSTVLTLAHTNSSAGGTTTGTLNINSGGTVMANSIVSGGGVSAITVSGGTLVVTNTAGTLAAPIGTFTMSGANLTIPALSTSASLSVKAISGDAVITISRIAPIGSYPTSIPIIHYQTDSGTTFTLAPVGGLPAGYTGSLVDAGGGKVSLNLTAGPVADLTETWSGANSADWDFSSLNWLFHSLATNYFDTAVVIFNDSTTQTNISLDQPLSPNSITVSNNTLQYTFGGIGNIAGTASLTKSGSSRLTLDNSGGVNNISTVIINGGTLQIGAGDANGGISSVNITDNGALVVDRTDTVTLSSDISGTGTLTQGGGGTLILSGANTYNGATALTNGTLEIDQTSSGTGPVTTLAGTILSGGGVVNGHVTVGGQLSPGPSTGKGIFQANNGLTLSAGSTLNFGLSATDPSLPANDSVAVTGNLAANNNVINVNFAGTPQGNTYTLFTYTGTLTGSFNPTITGTHFSTTLDTTSSPGSVLLTVTGGSGFALDWSSTSDSKWDTTTANWLNLANSTPSTFLAGDSVLFDDTPGVQTTIAIGAGITVYPSVITDNATNNNFTIGGAGQIAGSLNMVKSGPSILTLSTANIFTGTVDIQAGTLKMGNGAALGNVANTTTVENGATLDLGGQNIGARPITVSGSGVSGEGAIYNSGGAIAPQAIGKITMTGDTTFGGTGNWAVNNSGVTASLTGAFNLTKVGGNQITLQNLSVVDTGLQNIDIQQGILEFNGITPSMGGPTFTNIVEAGAELSFAQTSIVNWNKNFVFNGNGTATTVNNGTSATTELDGPVVLHGGVVFAVGGTLLTVTNTISGDGGVIKNGASPMIFSGPTTYTGDTTLNAAALRLQGSADLSMSTNIIINAGSTLTVTGMVNSTFILVSGHTLGGHGVVNGKLTANTGSIVSPSFSSSTGVSSPVGLLTVSNAIALSGKTIMELDPANGTNDMLKSGLSTITYGGTLNLTNLSSPLTNGSSFKLFSATSYIGSFSNITPATPGSGQAWDISALGTSGTIKVKVTTGPSFSSIVLAGTNVVFSGSNGVASNPYYVLTSTNVALPRTNWTSIATNAFDANGRFMFTNGMVPGISQRFYLLQVP
jgi:fibronectin-binding autotransporter adhesin